MSELLACFTIFAMIACAVLIVFAVVICRG